MDTDDSHSIITNNDIRHDNYSDIDRKLLIDGNDDKKYRFFITILENIRSKKNERKNEMRRQRKEIKCEVEIN